MGILTEFEREPWAMKQEELEAFLRRMTVASQDQLYTSITQRAAELLSSSAPAAAMKDFPDPPAKIKALMAAQAPPRAKPIQIVGDVAHIHVFGVLLKSVPSWIRWFEDEVTGYDELGADLAQAMGNPKVTAIHLEVESPGGMISGLKELADAVHAAAKTKKVTAHIEDVGASAAYWIASQADRVTANPNASVGSIGAYLAVWDYSKLLEDKLGIKVNLVKSGPHKGTGVLGTHVTQDQLKPMQELIDGIAGAFRADVARGRGRKPEDLDEWLSGRVWRAEEAVGLGLIDGIVNSGTASPGGPAAAKETPHMGGSMAMDEKELAAASQKGADEALAGERQRAKDIRAAFPKHPGFAAEQIEKGATLAEARASFADVVIAENAALQTENAKLKSGVVPPVGEDPIRAGGDPATAGNADFMSAARAHVKENGGTMRAAMSAVATKDPGLYDRYRQAQIARAPEHEARKRAAGVS